MNDQVKTEQKNEAHISPSELNEGLCVTEKMVDEFLTFTKKASYLQHPEVPYYGTVNGDSEEKWQRRYIKATLEHVLTHNVEIRG